MTRIFIFLLLLSPLTSFADYLKLNLVPDGNQTSTRVFSQSGVMAANVYDNYQTVVVGRSIPERLISDREFVPQSVNDSGNVVGIRFNVGPEFETDYAFYSPNGGVSQLLLTGVNLVGAAINNSNDIALLQIDRVTFFNGTTNLGTIALGAEQYFVSMGSTLMKGNRELIAQIDDLGTRKFVKVSLSSGVSLISNELLSGSAGIIREESNGAVLALNDGKVVIADLSTAPTALPGKRVVNRDTAGGIVGAIYSLPTSGVLYPFSDLFLQESEGGPRVPLECAFPKSQKWKPRSVNYIAQDGTMIADVLADNYRYSFAIMTKTGETLQSYCPTVTVQIVGKCKKSFKKTTSSLEGTGIRKGTRCEAEVSVKEPFTGKPLRGKRVASTSSGDTIIRGVTNSKGKVRFSFKVQDYTSMDIEAPFQDRRYKSQSWSLYASGS
jgi:hypothetical protein